MNKEVPKVYLASRYSRFKEMQGYATELKKMGYEVTSRWIQGNHKMSKGSSTQAEKKERIRFANEDKKDLNKSDIVICFTEEPRTTNTRGGRHVELGMAIAWEKEVYIIGYKENVFCCLPDVTFFKQPEEILKYLSDNISKGG